MNYSQWMVALNPAFRGAFFDSPMIPNVAQMDDLYLYLMM